ARKPKLVELAVIPWIAAVPEEVRLPLASGVPADGRTRTFCQVREQSTPALLADETVKVRAEDVTEVIATAVPLPTPLMFKASAPEPVTRVTRTVGAVPPV